MVRASDFVSRGPEFEFRCRRNSAAGGIQLMTVRHSLRKHAYSNTLKILSPKNENFQIKNSGIVHVSTQNTDCGYMYSLEPPQRGGSNEYPQSMF